MIKKIEVEDKNEFHAPTPVGKTRTMTPEGYLLCEDVRIARTGEQMYGVRELTDQQTGKPVVEPGPDGTVVIGRESAEVFRDETIKSFEGKSVTVEHPDEFVGPDNWKRVTVGTAHNVHRGKGDDAEFLMADLLITDKGAIDHVNRDMPQISCGYDSEYEQTRIGHGVQRNIVGNHVALVDRGRAGPRCSIRDAAFKPLEDQKMSGKVKIIDRLLGLLTAVKAKDQAALDKVLTEDEGDDPMGETFGSMDKKFEDWMKSADKKFEDWMKSKDAAPGSKEADGKVQTEKEADIEAKKVKEAEDTVIEPETLARNPDMMGRVWVGDSVAPFVKNVVARAEILAPGIAVPTADSVSQKGLKAFMLTALAKASTTDAGKECIAPFLSAGQTLDRLDGRALTAVFNGAAEVRRLKNNASFRPTAKTADFGKQVSVEDIQRQNEEFWANGGKRKVGGK
jgi:uncharacterized protein